MRLLLNEKWAVLSPDRSRCVRSVYVHAPVWDGRDPTKAETETGTVLTISCCTAKLTCFPFRLQSQVGFSLVVTSPSMNPLSENMKDKKKPLITPYRCAPFR